MNASHALERSTFAAWTGLSSHALMHTNRLIVPIIVVGIANKLPMMLGVCYTAVSLARMRSARNVWTGNVRRSLVTLSEYEDVGYDSPKTYYIRCENCSSRYDGSLKRKADGEVSDNVSTKRTR